MKNFFFVFLDFLKTYQDKILFISKWVLIISFIGLCVILSLFVLLQRGEEGAFSKNRGDKITTDNRTLLRATVICAIFLFVNAMLLSGVIYKIKHNKSQDHSFESSQVLKSS